MRGRRRRPSRPIARFVLPVAAGVVVFSAASGFAASLNVSSTSLGSGNSTVSSCNASASVSYNTAYASGIPGYGITTAPVTSAAACSGRSFKVTLTGASNSALAERTGTLDTSGNASPDFTSSSVSAAAVTGVSVVITG